MQTITSWITKCKRSNWLFKWNGYDGRQIDPFQEYAHIETTKSTNQQNDTGWCFWGFPDFLAIQKKNCINWQFYRLFGLFAAFLHYGQMFAQWKLNKIYDITHRRYFFVVSKESIGYLNHTGIDSMSFRRYEDTENHQFFGILPINAQNK